MQSSGAGNIEEVSLLKAQLDEKNNMYNSLLAEIERLKERNSNI